MNAERKLPLRLSKLSLVCVLIGMAGAPNAQTLTDVYLKARLQDPQYRSAGKSLQAALEKAPQARAALLPTINLIGSQNQQSGEASFSDAPFVRRDVQSWSWTVQLSQPLLRRGSWAGLRQAEFQVRQAQAQFLAVEQDLIVRVAQAYFDVLLAEQSVRVSQQQLQAIGAQMGVAERTYSVGTGTITDVHEAQAKRALSKAQLVATENELLIKQTALERILGESLTLEYTDLGVDLPPMESTSLSELLAAAAQGNPFIQVQQSAIEIAQQEVSRSTAGHYPTLDLVVNQTGNFNSGSLSSPADISTRVNSQQVGLQLNVPLFAGGSVRSKVREAIALSEKAKDELTLATRTVSSQVRQAFFGISNGQAQTAALQVAVTASENAVESNKIGYLAGTRINPDVLNAEQQLYTGLRDLARARAETVMQGLKLKAAVGSLDASDLGAIDNMLNAAKVNNPRLFETGTPLPKSR